MNDFYDETSDAEGSATSATSTAPTASMTADPPDQLEGETQEATPEPEEAKQTPVETESAAVTRFNSCRWRETQENAAAYCANRDVLPFAGKNGFNPEAWCPDCKLYKIKRKVKKRSSDDWNAY